jgi:Bacterial HORMA domain 2
VTTTKTATYSYTRAHTATHLSDTIMTSITDILITLGIEATRHHQQWQQNANAINRWIEEGSLKQVAVECVQPDGTVAPVFEFDVAYTAGGIGDRKFTADNASFLKYLAKIQRVPAGTTFRLFCSYRWTPSEQPGWISGTRASTNGLRTRSIGTLAGAPDATATARVHTL